MQVETRQRDYFEDLFEQGRLAMSRGEMDHALELCDQALHWAKQHGDAADADRATCNRYAILLETGSRDVPVKELQMILMRSSAPLNRYLAAYTISFYYELEEDLAKSRFYADVARDHANRTNSDYKIGRSCMRLGELLIRESRFDEAMELYEEAWPHFEEDEFHNRLLILGSIGFCHLACGRFTEGFEKLFTMRRSYLRLKMGPSSANGRMRLAFCFGYLELDRFHQAILHGQAALAIGEECGDRDLIKKSLYMLGEAEKLSGDEMKAFTHYAYLQEEFYPDNPMLPEILLYSDTNKLVNVWA